MHSLQRAPCDTNDLCRTKEPWDRWYRGFFQAAISSLRPSATVYRRSFGRERVLRPEAFSSLAENSSALYLQREMCFDCVVRRASTGAFYRSLSQSVINFTILKEKICCFIYLYFFI